VKRTFDLLNLKSGGHKGVERLFGQAHTHGWNLERDVDWTARFPEDSGLVRDGWAPFSRTRTFRRLPKDIRARFNKRALGWTLNSLKLGESVALEVCLKLAQKSRQGDHRNHAVAQAMDEARHHVAYARILEKMEQVPEEVDRSTRAMFDSVLELDNVVDLVAWEQFYLESVAMNVLRGIRDHAVHPLVRKVVALNLRDESRHMGFGVMFIREHLQFMPLDDRIAFSGRWLGQILALNFGQQDGVTLQRLARWLFEAGVPDSLKTALELMGEQVEVIQQELDAVTQGVRVPQELKNARSVGLLAPEILEALQLREHPFVLGALKGDGTPDGSS
jgi:hypothetical protein